jgi:DNA-binding GntR family transcriptional regulator
MSGKYKPGDRLVESKIAKEMGISQSPVREALRDLVAMRFVELLPHKGARVRQMDRREFLDIYPVRAALEEVAGTLAAGRLAEKAEVLTEAIARMARAFQSRDAREMAHWDVRFHRAIFEATGNQILIETWSSLMIESRTYLTLSNLMQLHPDLDLAERHRPILDALVSGDAEASGAAMRHHVMEFGGMFAEILPNDDEYAELALARRAELTP